MNSSANFQSPSTSVVFYCSCDKVYHKKEVRFILYSLDQSCRTVHYFTQLCTCILYYFCVLTDPSGHAPTTDQLEYITLRTIPNNECSYYLGPQVVNQGSLCAGVTTTGGKGPCQVSLLCILP